MLLRPVITIAVVATGRHWFRLGGREVALLLNLTIDAALKESMDLFTLHRDLSDVRQFGPDGDGVLVAAVGGEAQLFGIVCFEYNYGNPF